jgi:2Fe-2S ferredoxin
MPRISVVNRDGRLFEIDATSGISLMENIRGLDGSVDAICGGMCSCATCHVHIDDAWCARLPPRRYEETFMLDREPSFDPARSRLSCQIRIEDEYDGLRLTVAPEH